MFLSQLVVNVGTDPNRPRPGRLWVSNPYRVHQRLCMAFPQPIHKARDEEAGVLFRIEGSTPPRVLVQSAQAPDWEGAFGNAPFLLLEPPKVKTFEPEFQAGQRFRFYLRANPTMKKKVEGRKNNPRVGLATEEAQREWFERKAQEGGFAPVSYQVIAARPRVSRRSRMLDANPHTHLAVDYTGVLEVKDGDGFGKTLIAGIGSAKAYGFGLLSVARVGPHP